MSLEPNDRREIERCLSAARDGSLSPEQAAWLSARVNESEEFAWLYLQLSHLEAALRWDFSAGPRHNLHDETAPEEGLPLEMPRHAAASLGHAAASPGQAAMPMVFESNDQSLHADGDSPIDDLSKSVSGAGAWWWFSQSQLFSIAVTALACGLLAFIALSIWPRQGAQVATLTKSIESRWSEDRALEIGTSLHENQTLKLLEGAVEINYLNGASVWIEAPAEFRFTSPNSGRLSHGTVLAVVPPAAKGFSIETPLLTAIDLGTEFGVISRSRGGEVHVFAGHVEVRPDESMESLVGDVGKLRRLAAGEAVVVGEGSFAAGSADRSRFISPQQPIRRAELVGFYPFDGNARDASGAGRHATRLPNVRFVPGLEGQAAQLAGTSNSYIDLPIDAGIDNLPRLTWGAWIRPTALGPSPAGSSGERNHQILSTDNSRRSYDFDRVLTLDLRQGTSQTSGGHHRFSSFAGVDRGVVANADRDVEVGKWTFVAATYDQPRRSLALYVESPEPGADGRRLAKIEHQDTNFNEGTSFIRVGGHPKGLAHPVTRLGPLDAAESFYGEIDNVFVIDGCLTQDQLERIVAEGAPAILQFDRQQK